MNVSAVKSRLKWFSIGAAARLYPGHAPTALMYHSVNADSPHFFNVKPSQFIRQMEYLRSQGREFIGMDRLLEAYQGRWELAPRAICMTFDDGYLDNLTTALPILEQYGIPAIFYIATDFIERRVHKEQPMCSLAELRKLAAHPLVTIGSHTISHPRLDRIDPERARSEIAGGKARLEEWLGTEIRHFAYPKGRYHAGTVELVKEAGFATAVTVAAGPLDPKADPFQINRVSIDCGLPDWAFKLAIGRAFNAYAKMRNAWS